MPVNILIASDFHYAGPAERARRGYETQGIANPLMRLWGRFYYRFIWLHDPTAQHWRLEHFCRSAPQADWLITNGDYSCDSANTGVSDPAAHASALECLGRLRALGGAHFAAIMGDHELGKTGSFHGNGGLRLASYHAATGSLGLKRFWEIRLGRYLLIGVTSSLLAWAVYGREALPEEAPEWERLREEHLAEIRSAFRALAPGDRVVLFCHDPTALPYLGELEEVRVRLPQVEQTVIGHLHSPAVMGASRCLAGMPVISFLGRVPRRLSSALRRARGWAPFRPVLCPALSGIQLFKDGGFLTLSLDPEAQRPLAIQRHRFPWREPKR
jgi:3',5'-cyclic AMP phosphodiesterase CpdA